MPMDASVSWPIPGVPLPRGQAGAVLRPDAFRRPGWATHDAVQPANPSVCPCPIATRA